MLPIQIVFLLNVFDVFGYNSGSSKLTEHRKITYFIYFVHILIATFLTFFKPYSMFEYYSALGKTERINEFLVSIKSSLYKRLKSNGCKSQSNKTVATQVLYFNSSCSISFCACHTL